MTRSHAACPNIGTLLGSWDTSRKVHGRSAVLPAERPCQVFAKTPRLSNLAGEMARKGWGGYKSVPVASYLVHILFKIQKSRVGH